MKIRIKKLHPDAILPAYAHGPAEDAGLDLRAVERVVLSPGVAQAFPTGLAIELPPGYEAQVRPRSGMALKHSITVNFGTIDPGYRGEIRVMMFNLGACRLHRLRKAIASRSWSSRATKPSSGKRANWAIPRAARAALDRPDAESNYAPAKHFGSIGYLTA